MKNNALQSLQPANITQSTDLLNNLRDIHLPADPGWWPLALGWWLVLLLLFILVVLLVHYLKKRSLKKAISNRYSKYENSLSALLAAFEQHQDQALLLQDCSILLRQLSIEQDKETANITGSSWLRHLDSLFDSQAFTKGIGQLFADGHYQIDVSYDSSKLIALMHDSLHQLSAAQQVEKEYV